MDNRMIRLSAEAAPFMRTPILTGLSQPTSVVVGPDRAVYVTNHGLQGSVLPRTTRVR